MSVSDTSAVLERFWRAHEQGNPDALAAELHPEVIVTWPQSGERVHGRANLDAINRAMPGGHPKGKLLNLRVLGNTGILEMALSYGNDVYYVVEILEMKDGKVFRATEYFSQPFEAPAWRSMWVERMVEPPERNI